MKITSQQAKELNFNKNTVTKDQINQTEMKWVVAHV